MTSPLRFFDLAQLLLLVDALTRLSIASQHRFGRRRARGRQFIFEIARFLSCGTCSFFSLTQIVSDSEFQFGDFVQLGFRFFKNSREL